MATKNGGIIETLWRRIPVKYKPVQIRRQTIGSRNFRTNFAAYYIGDEYPGSDYVKMRKQLHPNWTNVPFAYLLSHILTHTECRLSRVDHCHSLLLPNRF